MAKLTPISTTYPINRRHGGVFYKAYGQNVLRSMAVPLQPKTGPQAKAQVNFSNAVSLWQSMGPALQAIWNGSAPANLTGYAFFLQTNMYWLTWGYEASVDPDVYARDISGLICNWEPNRYTSPVRLYTYIPANSEMGPTCTLAVYAQLSYLSPFYYYGNSDTPPTLVAPASGYVFIGLYFNQPTGIVYYLDISAELEAVFGQLNLVYDNQPSLERVYGSYIDVAVATIDYSGNIGYYLNPSSPYEAVYPPFPNPAGNF